ncbi:MAG TPA: phosphatidylserine decarboxylase family protein [Bacteroidia bacterium]|jgi:phosphatidylserine decarboxylase
MRIHKEGWPSIILVLLFSAAICFCPVYFLPTLHIIHILALALSIFLIVMILQFFRNPSREIAIGENTILAPADGKVVVIEEVEEKEYFHDKRIQVSIFMSPLNVHVNRNPVGGIVRYMKYHPGKYLVAWHPKSSTENERTTVVIEHKSGQKILFRQIAGAMARRIVYYVKEGDAVKQGEEMGFIKFGSRVDVLLPLSAKIKVKLDDVSVSPQTVIAEL